MKHRYTLFAVIMILALCLAGCSSRREPEASATPDGGTTTVTPSVPETGNPDDFLPGNDANEGGGAGGTNDYDDSMNNHGSNGTGSGNGSGSGNGGSSNNNGSGNNGGSGSSNAGENNGTNREDGLLDNAGDAVDGLLDGAGNAIENGGKAIGRAISPNR